MFDEIDMNNFYILDRIREFVTQHPDKVIIGVGGVWGVKGFRVQGSGF